MLEEKTEIIFKYLIKIGASPLEAEDIIQDACYKLLLYMDSIDPNKAYSWLFRVAINQYYDYCRKGKRQIYVALEQIEFVDDSPLPEDLVENEELKHEIQLVLNQLSPKLGSIEMSIRK
jgi:RNA polymerase sigma-70 factor (ECF subfamily)